MPQSMKKVKNADKNCKSHYDKAKILEMISTLRKPYINLDNFEPTNLKI